MSCGGRPWRRPVDKNCLKRINAWEKASCLLFLLLLWTQSPLLCHLWRAHCRGPLSQKAWWDLVSPTHVQLNVSFSLVRLLFETQLNHRLNKKKKNPSWLLIKIALKGAVSPQSKIRRSGKYQFTWKAPASVNKLKLIRLLVGTELQNSPNDADQPRQQFNGKRGKRKCHSQGGAILSKPVIQLTNRQLQALGKLLN